MASTTPEATGPGRSAQDGRVSAAIIVIGDEILSGRTQDANTAYIARWLGELGIDVGECRIIPDVEDEIVRTVNELREKFDYVFTTGGIGPTHDDITADSVARAFGVGIDYHPEALAVLEAHYEKGQLTEARKRMARVPDGADLIDNPISKAPGFQIGNVFVMAGIPIIMQTMLESVRHRIAGGQPVVSRTVTAHLPEGAVADGLRRIQENTPEVSIGSYPFYRGTRYGTSLVMRSPDPAALERVVEEVRGLIRDLGADPVDGDAA